MSKVADKVKIMISDCHLSAGRVFDGNMNPHEDFHFDDELCDFVRYFSTGAYASGTDGPEEVELILGGDFLDFLNVPIRGEFEDVITEEIAVYKVRAILNGHKKVNEAFREFCRQSGKKITYLIGNHDADLFFEGVRREITKAWDPEGRYPSDQVSVVADRDRLTYPEKVEFRHGNQMEAGSDLDFEEPFHEAPDGRRFLRLPWSSIYVLKIVNRLKWEREFLDKIRPIKVYVLFGLLFDPIFTIRYCFLSTFYFFKTRLFSNTSPRRSGLTHFFETLREESTFFQDLERPARKVLDERDDVKTIIMGHTHRPMDKIYPDGKQYINTGTWTKMIDLDWRGLGQQFRRTFALVHITDGKSHAELRQWIGEHGPHRTFQN